MDYGRGGRGDWVRGGGGQLDPAANPESQIPASSTIYYRCDTDGHLLSKTDNSSSVVWVYNDDGPVTSVTIDSSLPPPTLCP